MDRESETRMLRAAARLRYAARRMRERKKGAAAYRCLSEAQRHTGERESTEMLPYMLDR